MGRRGPSPTPTANLARRGSWRSKTRPGEPDAIEAPPPRPQTLGPVASAVWDAYEPILRRMRVLSHGDGIALELLARTYEAWQAASGLVELHGILIDDGKGGMAANPAVAVRDRAEVRLKGLLGELGLSPSGRARVKVLEEPKPKGRGLADLD